MKKYLVFDMDGTLIESETVNFPLEYEHLKKYLPDLEYDYFKYVNIQNAGSPISDSLRILSDNTLSDVEIRRITNELFQIILDNSSKHPFFEGVIDMIEQLSQEYTLFLSTGNSDEYAQEKLKDAGVSGYFKHILGSSKIGKSVEHIKVFKDISGDDDFEKYAVFVGDGNTDREIARSAGIDFIKIGKTGNDTYEVDKTIEAVEIIKSL